MCELQLHLKAIHDIKPVQHRCYQMLRGAGWDKEEARAHHLARRQAQLDEEVLIEKTKRAIEKLEAKDAAENGETQDAAEDGETPVELLNGNDSDLVLSQSEGEGEGEDQSLSDDAASWGSWGDSSEGEGAGGGGGGGGGGDSDDAASWGSWDDSSDSEGGGGEDEGEYWATFKMTCKILYICVCGGKVLLLA